ncbi:MAG TPA: HAD-IIIA family hydrolase [Acidimicrobiia bacterium]|nr:HAD-IIIA family hydrolase [Acidimicrobiia bacterium]
MSSRFTVVIPTIGRPTLSRLVERVAWAPEVIVVDDRPRPHPPLDFGDGVRVTHTTGGRGPAAARNAGWRLATSEWVAFLDDDVIPDEGWVDELEADLAACGREVAASQGRVEVPLPTDRRPTDRERNVAGLASSRWITADMAYRRTVLERFGGFDERFERAFREDSDLALRVSDLGWKLMQGRRRVVHPVGRAPWWVSIADQRGNRDNVLMGRLHGPNWREAAGAGPGMIGRHLLTTGFLGGTLVGALTRRRRMSSAAGMAWAAFTAAFAWRRIRPGPRTPGEVAAMLATSVAIPPAAVFWRIYGLVADGPLAGGPPPAETVDAVLFDRDGTLVIDVPYNGDPSAVRLVPGAADVLSRLRRAGLALGMITNQSGVGRGLIDEDDVQAVNRRIEELVGPFDTVVYCPHLPEDGCTCRKPAPGLVQEAARRIGVDPARCVVVGDILTDVLAGEAAGARAVLVPNGATAPGEVSAATHVAADLEEAADLVLTWRRG